MVGTYPTLNTPPAAGAAGALSAAGAAVSPEADVRDSPDDAHPTTAEAAITKQTNTTSHFDFDMVRLSLGG
jgi:hypothetical protein